MAVWERHTFSQGCISFNHVLFLKMTHFFLFSYITAEAGQSTGSYMSSGNTSLLVSPRRQDVGAEEVLSF